MTAKKTQKAQTRNKILLSASNLFREQGIENTSVAQIMKGAELTVGGFYAHFASKEELVEEALHLTMEQMRSILITETKGVDDTDNFIEKVLKSYLSEAHRDNPAQGCPLPAMVSDISKTNTSIQYALAEELEQHIDLLASKLDENEMMSSRDRAVAILALMFGSLTLSRALKETALSEQFLQACRMLASINLDLNI